MRDPGSGVGRDVPISEAYGVFKNGGIRGLGLAGAVAAVMDAGYRFTRVAGTSAGALVAALVAAGYQSADLRYASVYLGG